MTDVDINSSGIHDPALTSIAHTTYIVICATISLHPPQADLYLPSSAFVRFRDWQFMDVPQCTTTTARLRPDGFFIHFPRTTVELISATKHYALAVVQIIIFRTRLTRSLLRNETTLISWLVGSVMMMIKRENKTISSNKSRENQTLINHLL